MLRYVLVFSILFVLGFAACAAASAADAPAVGQVAFGVSLGLFVAALAVPDAFGRYGVLFGVAFSDRQRHARDA